MFALLMEPNAMAQPQVSIILLHILYLLPCTGKEYVD